MDSWKDYALISGFITFLLVTAIIVILAIMQDTKMRNACIQKGGVYLERESKCVRMEQIPLP